MGEWCGGHLGGVDDTETEESRHAVAVASEHLPLVGWAHIGGTSLVGWMWIGGTSLVGCTCIGERSLAGWARHLQRALPEALLLGALADGVEEDGEGGVSEGAASVRGGGGKEGTDE